MRLNIVTLLALAGTTTAQDLQSSLATALADNEDLSKFVAFIEAFPNLLSDVFSSSASNSTSPMAGVTVLVPTNDAIDSFTEEYGDPSNMPESQIKSIFSYHVMVAPLIRSNFSQPNGLTVPTFLTGRDENGVDYNLRQPAPQLQSLFGSQATGQVLFAKQDLGGVVKLMTRQDSDNVPLRAGLGQTVSMNLVDGKWDGGVYQVINEVLVPPKPCSRTARTFPDELSSLDTALNRTDLWSTLDTSPNVTCLAPNSAAFAAAGDPDKNLPVETLTEALLNHTLKGPAYSNFLVDGMKMETVNNNTVLVTINETGTYFNDAKVVAANVLTNNGLIHILDKVMTPLSENATKTGGNDNEPTATGSGSTSTPTESQGAGSALAFSGLSLGAVVIAAAALF